jgi:hypothetical protein
MSLKDLLTFVKQSGMVPFEMLQPGLEWMANNFNGEIRIFLQRSVGTRIVLKLPGLDALITQLIDS